MRDFSELNQKMVEFATKQLEKGDVDSGLYNYYISRLNKGAMISDYETYIANYILDCGFPITRTKVLEPASGIATLSYILRYIGFSEVTASEHDKRRLAAGQLLGEYLGSSINWTDDGFPLSGNRYDLVVMTNARGTGNKFSQLIDYIHKTNNTFLFMPRLWDPNITDYKAGCEMLLAHGILFEELQHEFVTIRRY